MFFRFRSVLLAVVVILVLLSTFFANWNSGRRWRDSLGVSVDEILLGGARAQTAAGTGPAKPPNVPGKPSHDEQIAFWELLARLFDASNPHIEKLQKDGNTKVVGFKSLDFANHDQRPVQHVRMTDEEVSRMRAGHEAFVRALDSPHSPKMVYVPGTTGIVVTAGGKYLPLVVISLRIMRRIGSTLPMEVFLETAAEYESHVCEDVLPSLGARCIILSEIVDPVPHPVQLKSYQLKVFALLFSSFEDVLFLDADAWPTLDPGPLFDAEPFVSTGLVTWPDFWALSFSDFFYTISDTSSSSSPSTYPRYNMTDRASSETGEILVSKARHQKSLLLAAYYNYFGPGVYYTLFSQGAPGEGDKETFLAAADVLGEPYYAVSETLVAIGHVVDDKHGWSGSAMVQFDPREDYELTSVGKYRIKDPNVAPRPRPMFVHANFPKLNPGTIYDNAKITKTREGGMRRAWDIPEDLRAGFGTDVERRFWEEAEWVACNLETKFRNWYKLTGTCDKAKAYYRNVFGGTKMNDYRDIQGVNMG